MRGDDQIGNRRIEQNIAVLRRLGRQHVETGAGDHALAQRVGERGFIDNAATRGVDDAGALLHRRQLFRADHVLGLRRQRQIERHNVGLAQQGRDVDDIRSRNGVVDQHLHAERDGALFDFLAERAIADDAERRSGDVVDRIIEIAELVGVAPATMLHRIVIIHQIAAQREQQREHMFGQRVERVIANVGDGDSIGRRIGLVDHVGAGGGDGDQLEAGQLLQRRLAQRHLVGDADIGALQTLDDLIRRGLRIFNIFMREIRLAHIGVQRFAVKKDDFVRHEFSLPVLNLFSRSPDREKPSPRQGRGRI